MSAIVECQIVESDAEFAECLNLRIEVFVHEQGVPEEEELDELDASAIHLLARCGGAAVGTGRLVVEDGRGRIGRMAVRQDRRRQGIGTAIVQRFLALAQEQGLQAVYLAAQLHAIPFYERFGFAAEGEIHLDGGLPHRWMTLRFDHESAQISLTH